MPLPLESDRDVGVFGFQAIEKIRGLLVGIDVQDQPETWDGTGQVVKVDLEDATVLKMFGDEEPFDLKDGKFSFIMPYKLTATGKISPGTGYDKCWRASAKELGKLPSEFIGEYVTLEKQPRVLFKLVETETDSTGKKHPKLDEEGNKITRDVLAVTENGLPKYFCFVPDETADADNVKEKVRGAIVGLTEKATLRKLLIEFKQYPEYKEKLNAGTLGDYLGLALVDGKFTEDIQEVSGGTNEASNS